MTGHGDYALNLLDAANAVLSALNPHEISGPINWGDLRCVAVEHVQTFSYVEIDPPAAEWRVLIEEAFPDARELQTHITNKLIEAGFHDVEVRTDW